MRFRHRDEWVSGSVAVTLRDSADVNEEAEFEIPEEHRENVGLLQRLVDAGHEPVDSDALPDGVQYEAGEAEEPAAEEADTAEEEPDADGDEGGEEPVDDLADLDRSALWELAHTDEFAAEPEFSWNDSTAEKLRDWIRERREEE